MLDLQFEIRHPKLTIMTIVTRKVGMVTASDTWSVANAKAKLSELIENARAHGPQTITKNGRRFVVVVSTEEWEKKAHREGSLAQFLAASPLPQSGLQVERVQDNFRQIDL